MTLIDIPLDKLSEAVAKLWTQQLATWPAVSERYAALRQVQVRQVQVRGVTYRLQHNPARVRSSAARIDRQSISARPCFLCLANRPVEQLRLPVLGRYEVLVNPYPIFPRHLTIVGSEHRPQAITDITGITDVAAITDNGSFSPLRDMLRLAQALPDYTLFYNGPRSGASAPDHFHFQAGSRGVMPIEGQWWERRQEAWVVDGNGKWQATEMKRQAVEMERQVPEEDAIRESNRSLLYRLDDAPRHAWVIDSAHIDEAIELFAHFYRALQTSVDEPMLNLLARYDSGRWRLFIFPRKAHRPSCYFRQGDERILLSPASVDLGGLFVVPMEVDFHRLDEGKMEEILAEVCLDFRPMMS